MLKTEHSHSPEDIAQRLNDGPRASYLKEWVYGGIDGVVTTFAVVAAVIGADLSTLIVVIMGLANLVGDGFSMAASSFSGAKAEQDNYNRLREVEATHIVRYPEGEKEETRQIFAAKGFAGAELEHIVDTISSDKKLWIDVMLQEEYGISAPLGHPMKVAVHTFLAFMVCGSMPLIPYVVGMPQTGVWSLIMSGATFFAIGSFKSLWSIKSWWREGAETFLIGMTAAGLAYGIGYGLQGMVP